MVHVRRIPRREAADIAISGGHALSQPVYKAQEPLLEGPQM